MNSQGTTKSNPLPLGSTAILDEWEVTVFECIRRADRLVADANTYNDTARRGSYLVVAYQVTYIGDGDATAGMNLTVGLAGANKILYRDFDAAVDLGDLSYDPPLEAGGTVERAVALDVPDDVIDGGAIFVEEMTFNARRAYWSTRGGDTDLTTTLEPESQPTGELPVADSRESTVQQDGVAVIEALQALGDLYDKGFLSDDEFKAAKARVLKQAD